ncbi:MAG TPA: DcaP family trimeric outer membrane transporter [Candidatus Angelobacter sp.]|nr:DcaP family trimeric outer membrane transporter [Candidatus Angelobacter sp.]
MNALTASRFFLCLFSLAAFPSWTYGQTTAKEPDAQALQQQVDTLKTQIADLEDKIKNLTSTGPATPDSSGAQQAKGGDAQQGGKKSEAAKELDTEETVSKATADYKMFSEDEEAAARYDNVPLDPRYPNYFRLPGTRTFMRIGGYAKSDLTFDPRPAGDQDRFIPASIPIPAPAANVSNSTVSARPSRINVDFLVPIEKERALRFFLEMDFFGSSSTTPRLRHAYAQGKNLLIGQTFSNFMDVDAGPDTLDFQGPNSWVSIRNPQVRYTHRFGKATTGSISVEKPSSDVAFKTPDFNAQPNSPSPDGTLQIRHEMGFGHVQFAGLFRDISAFLPDGRSDSVFGWGFNLAGLFKIAGKDALVYQGAYGNGIERYINDTSGLGIDAAVISAQKPHLEAVPAIATYGGYQHFWSPKLRSSAVFGFLQAENTAAQVSSAFHRSEYSAVNLIWSPIASLSFGSEFLYGWRVNKDNSTGNAPRIQLSAKYNFMQMKSSK